MKIKKVWEKGMKVLELRFKTLEALAALPDHLGLIPTSVIHNIVKGLLVGP